MDKYFLKPDGSISLVLVDNPANPDNFEIKSIKKLPAPIEYCTHKDGKIFAKEGYLDDVKAIAKQEINTMRDQHEMSVFMFNGIAIDCDQNSRQRLVDACVSAQTAVAVGLDLPEIVWTCADNSTMKLGVKDLLLMQTEQTKHMQACHGWATDLKAKIDTAESVEAVNQLLIDAGVRHAD